MVYKFQVSSLDELSFFPRVWSAVLVKCDEGRFSSSVFTSPHTIGAARFGQLDAVHFSICWPLWHHCLVWLGSQNAFWSDSNHNGQSWNPELVFENTNGWCIFVADPKEIWNSGMYRRISSRMVKAFRSSTSQNLWISSLGSLLLMCSGSLSKVSANETDTGTCLFSNNRFFVNCLCLLMSCTVLNQARRHVRKFPFSETLV